MTASTTTPLAASAISGHLDTRTAAMEVAHTLHETVGGACDLAVLFGSFHHRAAFAEAGETMRQTIGPEVLIGVTAESVLGEDEEREGVAGLSALAMRLPDVSLQPWYSTPDFPIRISQPETIPERIGLADDFRGAILLGDPFTTPIARLLPALADCGPRTAGSNLIVGGMASGASQPGHNALLLNEHMLTAGAVGVSLGGDVHIDTVVSQGCRPIAAPFTVTKAHQNVILELDNEPAFKALQGLASQLDEHEKQLLGKGLFIGTVVNTHKEHVGRGDFLIRKVMGFNQKVNGIVVGDFPSAGTRIQFHVHDAETAGEDLQLLLDAQELHEPPIAAMLFSCNGRGQRLFNQPHHDISMIRERLGTVPLAGFFAAGEIGPIAGRSYLHGHTACLMLLRPGSVQ